MRFFFALLCLYGLLLLETAVSESSSNEIKDLNPVFDSVDRFADSPGALFFMTNHPDGNFIVTGALETDGSVIFDKAFSTRGLGLHGINAPNSADGTFSQGSVRLSTASNVLAVVNPGSSTVSLFSINPQNPLDIDLIGEPVSSGGQFPMSVAFSANGSAACVLNGGELSAVQCFKVDQSSGLTPIANSNRVIALNQTTPPSGPPGTASQILFIENDSKVAVSIKGVPPTPGFFAVFDVNTDGSLSESPIIVPPAKGGMLPFSMNLIPGQEAVFFTDAGIGFGIFDFSRLSNGVVSSPQDSITAISGQQATCWSVFSEKTGNFYTVDVGSNIITEIHVDKNLKTNIVRQYPQTQGASTIDSDVATLNKQDFMITLEASTASIGVMNLLAPGQTKHVGSFELTKLAKAAGLPLINDNLQGMATFVTKRQDK